MNPIVMLLCMLSGAFWIGPIVLHSDVRRPLCLKQVER